jgi:hypothetical protein
MPIFCSYVSLPQEINGVYPSCWLCQLHIPKRSSPYVQFLLVVSAHWLPPQSLSNFLETNLTRIIIRTSKIQPSQVPIYICNIEREKYRERCSILLTVHMCIHMFIAFHSNGVPAGLWFGLCIGCAQQRLWRAFGGARGLVTRWPLSGGRCKGKYGKTLGKLRVKLKKRIHHKHP